MVVGLALGVSPVACTKKGDDQAQTRAQTCQKISDQLVQQAELAMKMVAAMAGPDDEDGAELAAEAKSEMRAMAEKMKTDCLTWPEETLECFADPVYAMRHTDECERAAAAYSGEPLPPADVPAGPEPAWTHTFAGKPSTLRLLADGLVVARFYDYDSGEGDAEGTWYKALVAVKDGKPLWAHEGDYDASITEIDDATFGVVQEGKLLAITAATGETAWTFRLSTEGIEGFDPEYDSAPWIKVVAREGDGLIVGDGEARFSRVSGNGTKQESLGRLTDETLDSDAEFVVSPDGLRWLWETYDVRAFDAQWNTKVALRAHDSLSAVHPFDGGAALLIDGEVMVIDAGKCGGSTEFAAPSKWPHKGEMFVRDMDECADCGQPPAGCVVWQSYVADVSHEPMAALPDGGWAVSDGTHTFAFRDGKEIWKSATSAGGRTIFDGSVYAIWPGGEEDDEPMKLWALAPATGKHQWGSVLPKKPGGWMYSTDEVHLHKAGDWLLAGYGDTISLLPAKRG